MKEYIHCDGEKDIAFNVVHIDNDKQIAAIASTCEGKISVLEYSRGLPMYLISDIHNSDVVANVGVEEKKLLLFDDFTCWDCGELIGKISDEAKERLRKANN